MLAVYALKWADFISILVSLKNAIISVGQTLMPYSRNSAKKTAVSDGVKSDVAKKYQPFGQENDFSDVWMNHY